MDSVRIAVASTPATRSLDEAVPAATAAIAQAAELGAKIICLPETGLPGHRSQRPPLADVRAEAIEEALGEVGEAARRAGVVAIVGAERLTASGREIVSVVFATDGTRLGVQVKTQIDPSEEADYVPGSGREVFHAAGVTFGVAICHEAFRYPEVSRALVVAGAQVIFAPHFVVTADGSLPVRWGDPANPYNEKALMMRALENTVYVAAANAAMSDQGSVTGIIAPDGQLVAQLAYGSVGVVVADIDPRLATRALALRWAPDRNGLVEHATLPG